jgi:hypothetical protein|tara:strand:- start:434 stop:907 length:474 start_codon:yes stop_codon:yes gene_type:complete
MSEKNFWNLIRINLDLNMYRIENRVSSGMPDIHYICRGSSGWIELKYIEGFPKKGKLKIGLRLAQHLWHLYYTNSGGQTWILVRVGREGTYLIDGKYSGEIQKMPNNSSFLKMCKWKFSGNMSKNDWKGLKDAITGEDKPKDKIGSENIRGGKQWVV